jgi:hypothetical protein
MSFLLCRSCLVFFLPDNEDHLQYDLLITFIIVYVAIKASSEKLVLASRTRKIVRGVNFGKACGKFRVRMALVNGGTLDFYLDSLAGHRIGVRAISVTGGVSAFSTQICDLPVSNGRAESE